MARCSSGKPSYNRVSVDVGTTNLATDAPQLEKRDTICTFSHLKCMLAATEPSLCQLRYACPRTNGEYCDHDGDASMISDMVAVLPYRSGSPIFVSLGGMGMYKNPIHSLSFAPPCYGVYRNEGWRWPRRFTSPSTSLPSLSPRSLFLFSQRRYALWTHVRANEMTRPPRLTEWPSTYRGLCMGQHPWLGTRTLTNIKTGRPTHAPGGR